MTSPLSGLNILEFAERGGFGITSRFFLSRSNTDGQVKGFAHRAMCVKVSSTADIFYYSSKSHLLVERSVYKWLKGCSIVVEQKVKASSAVGGVLQLWLLTSRYQGRRQSLPESVNIGMLQKSLRSTSHTSGTPRQQNHAEMIKLAPIRRAGSKVKYPRPSRGLPQATPQRSAVCQERIHAISSYLSPCCKIPPIWLFFGLMD
jgi:hypothetical protein